MDIDECVAAYKAGESLNSIAKRAGVGRTTLTKRLRARVAIKKPGHSRPKLRDLGPSWDDLGMVPDEVIGKRVGCSRQNVAKVRRARGIPSHRETRRKGVGANNTDGTDDI